MASPPQCQGRQLHPAPLTSLLTSPLSSILTMRFSGLWTYLVVLTVSVQIALADTEIRNFRLPLSTSSPTLFNAKPQHRYTNSPLSRYDGVLIDSLDNNIHQLNLTLSSTESEKYVTLHADTDQLWTIRISWPASVSSQPYDPLPPLFSIPNQTT